MRRCLRPYRVGRSVSRRRVRPVELALGDHVGDHRGLDAARADSVDAAPAGRILQVGAGSQPDHAVLGGVVRGQAGESDETTEGGPVHDRATALGEHLSQLVFHAGPHPAQVDLVDTIKDFGWFVGGIAGWNLDAGVVQRHVEPTERVDGCVHHGSHAVFVGHVATNAQHLVADGGQVIGSGTKRALVDIGRATAEFDQRQRSRRP
jgi:hypothetical protein